MNDFPDFMKRAENAIPSNLQSKGVEGWVYNGIDNNQMAYWTCNADGISEEHVHDFDEYFTVVQGTYTVIIDSIKHPVTVGQEYFIPKGVPHAGEFIVGTRTIHCFGGQRIKKA